MFDVSKYIPCGYYRVSRTDTAENKLAVQKYRQQIIRAGVKEADIFYDFDSGSKGDRANYQKMLKAVRGKRYNLVIIPFQSRLNRNVLNSELLLAELKLANAKILDLESNKIIDPNNPSDLLVYRMKAVVDNQKLDEIRSSSASNHAYLRSRRLKISTPFGYTLWRGKPYLDTKPFVCLLSSQPDVLPPANFEPPFELNAISPAQVLKELIDNIFLYENVSMAVEKINVLYGIPKYIPGRISHRSRIINNFYNDKYLKHRQPLSFTHRGVKNLITNPLLKGDLVYLSHDRNRETIVHEGEYASEAIVTPNQWQQLQILKANPINKHQPKDRYPYAGKIWCSHCQTRLRSRQGHKSTKHPERPAKKGYYCRNSGHGCPCRVIWQSTVDEVVIPSLLQHYREIAMNADRDNREKSPELLRLNNQLESLKSMPNNSAIILAISETKKQIKALISKQSKQENVRQEGLSVLESVFSNPLYWETLTDIQKWEINQYLIDRIEIATKDRNSYVFKVNLLV